MLPMIFSSRSGASTLARWVLLLAGVGVSTVGFVGIAIAQDDGRGTWPWGWIGLVGLAGVVLALGAPWRDRTTSG